jgi:S1-C subfamily serine protease
MRWVMVGASASLLALGACSASNPTASTSSPTSGAASPARSGNESANAATVAALNATFTDVVSTVGPSVVLIQTSQGLGSGEVYDNQGNIVTNAHVVGTATTFRVTTSTGKQLSGTLVGTFPPDDLAVIKVNGNGLKPAVFGDSARLKVGQPVIAIGNPLGLEGSVTSGVVSALGRIVPEGQGGGTLPDAIQASAEINPGNSGGALVDLSSQVIGIPTLAALSPGGSGAPAPGIGFAISSNRAKLIANQLIQYGKVVNSHRAYLGVQVGDIASGRGVLVVSVEAGGPAAKAGISGGDVITSVNGQATPDTSALSAVLAGLSPGQTVPVAIIHPDGTTSTVTLTLGELPG